MEAIIREVMERVFEEISLTLSIKDAQELVDCLIEELEITREGLY